MADHPLEDHRLPGLGPMRQTRLEQAGIRTLEALSEAPLELVGSLPGFTPTIAERVQASARDLLAVIPEDTEPTVELVERVEEPVDSAEFEPLRPRLRRGLEAARRVEDTRSMIRRVRALLRPERKRAPLHLEREMLRADLKRLIKTLARVQREAITHGLSKSASEDVDSLLSKMEHRLERFSEREQTAGTLRKLHARMERYRRDLKARLA